MSTSGEIEAIVRRVLTRMLAHDALPVAEEATQAVVDPSSILRIADSLISLASLPRDLKGIREVHLRHRSVVTPAVRDLFRSANITVVRTNASQSNPGPRLASAAADSTSPPSISSRPAIVVTGSAAFLPTLARSICPRQAAVHATSPDDSAALREAAIGLRNGHRAAVIIGTAAHALAWQAARDEKLRPVVIGQWPQLVETLAEVPTNLVILSTKHWNAPAASNVIRTFYKHLTQS